MTDLPSHYYDSIYGNDPQADNGFGDESLRRTSNSMLREYLRRGGLLSEFARQSAAEKQLIMGMRMSKRDIREIGSGAAMHSQIRSGDRVPPFPPALPAISKREDVA